MARLGIKLSLGVGRKDSFGVTWPVDRPEYAELGNADMVLVTLGSVPAVGEVVGQSSKALGHIVTGRITALFLSSSMSLSGHTPARAN